MALLINMIGGAIRFEVRMSRMERDIEWIKRSMPVPRRRSEDPD